ncbi:pleckstrin homology domain-containing family F member 1-like [Archocentrus centrarchus]|uniref:pleckstrin homology domain-containing family F member 1-like n=1 Tax=Archocentrus centrarchus TaxID=63155 RepID=UPI0011E9C91D|nr:pleckstrin homology domain-containing family F member 1-like [Archocentrus centrarchus]
MDQLMTAQYNLERVQAVARSFGSSGKRLLRQDRILVREGTLLKQSRRGLQPKAFFLFNDVLVYGSIVLNGRWHKKQQIFPLENILLEDVEDGARLKNQWLIRTPKKCFYVSAASYEEKKAWIENIEDCKDKVLQSRSRSRSCSLDFAGPMIPEQASVACMRCTSKFTKIQRRYHCRKCGFVVCSTCSRKRVVIKHIDPTKQLRVCPTCHISLNKDVHNSIRMRWDSAGKSTEEEMEYSEEEDED